MKYRSLTYISCCLCERNGIPKDHWNMHISKWCRSLCNGKENTIQRPSESDLLLQIHKSRRRYHSLCQECVSGYISPIVTLIIKNIANGIAPNYTVKCPGSIKSVLRNQCSHTVDINDIDISCITDTRLADMMRDIISYRLDKQFFDFCPHDFSIVCRKKSKRVTCRTCKSRNGIYTWCHTCRASPFHSGKTCIEHAISIADEREEIGIKSLVDSGIAKLCPVCNMVCIKEEGCNKMICGSCNSSFCWLCSNANIDYSHFNPKNRTRCSNRLWD